MKLKNIRVTKFGSRHFDRKFGGTKILDVSIGEFENHINDGIHSYNDIKECANRGIPHHISSVYGAEVVDVIDGYAPFCKLLVVKNFTEAKTGTLPIKPEYQSYIRHGFSSRRDSELAVESVWIDMPRMFVPKADYLVVVLYSREQIEQEHEVDMDKLAVEDYEAFEFALNDTEWGAVAILGQMHPGEEPMKPITMMRNSLGKEEGGSGVSLDREAYDKSVEFWSKNLTVK